MAGLDPAIHVFGATKDKKDVDARDKRGRDGHGIFIIASATSIQHFVIQDGPKDQTRNLEIFRCEGAHHSLRLCCVPGMTKQFLTAFRPREVICPSC